jgi:hypothetical protein
MEQVWRNMDLRRMIFSFGSPEHRTHMKEIVGYFRRKKKYTQFNIHRLCADWKCYRTYHPNRHLDQMIPTIFTEEEQDTLLYQMIDCKCCTRHTHGKPVRSHLWESEYNSVNTDGCLCYCRHMARVLLYSIQNHDPSLRACFRSQKYYINSNDMY